MIIMGRYKTLILNSGDIQKIVTIKESIATIEKAFRSFGEGKVQMPAKLYIHLDRYEGDFRAMPAFIEDLNCCAIKWVNVHPKNKRFGLPTVMAIIILSDPKNGFPLCIMDGMYATALRTGAAGGLAAKYLARKESKKVGLVGCGVQARTQLAALWELFKIEEVKVWGNKKSHVKNFIEGVKNSHFVLKIAKDIKDCVKDSDIVVTTTPSRKPLVKLKWLKKGTHINAMGADARGKRELEPAILKKAKIVVDAWEQARHSGEINITIKNGILSREDIYADIGEIAAGKKKGRKGKGEITIFDSTGLAIQDVAIASLIYKKAVKKKMGKWVRLIQ